MAELKQQKKSTFEDKQARITAILDPVQDRIPDGFELKPRGVFLGSTRLTRRPIWPAGVLRDHDGGGHALLVRGIVDASGTVTELEVSFDLLHGSSARLAAYLSESGLRVEVGAARDLAQYLNAFRTTVTFIRVKKCGWIGDPWDSLQFALPTGVIGEPGNFDLSRLRSNPLLKSMVSKGTLEEWQDSVARLAKQHHVVVAILCTPFAAVTMPLLEAEPVGVHLRDKTTTGKTTTAAAASSVFGRPYAAPDGPAYLLTLNATGNWLEMAFTSRNHVLMALDELGLLDGLVFSTLIYRLSGGVTKGRLARDGSMREGESFSLCYVTTGERSISELLAEDERIGRVRAGQLVRCLNCETGGNIILADTPEEAKKIVHDLKEAMTRNYGVAGPAFIERLIAAIKNGQVDRELLMESWEEITNELLLPQLEVHQQRAVKNLALICLGGCLACELGVLPFDQDDVIASFKVLRSMYLASDSLSDAALAARKLRDHISARIDRYGVVGEPSYHYRGQAGSKWRVQGEWFYLFTREDLCRAAGVTDPREVLLYLKHYGLLKLNSPGKLQAKVPAGDESSSRQHNRYAISEALLEWTDDMQHPPRVLRKK